MVFKNVQELIKNRPMKLTGYCNPNDFRTRGYVLINGVKSYCHVFKKKLGYKVYIQQMTKKV